MNIISVYSFINPYMKFILVLFRQQQTAGACLINQLIPSFFQSYANSQLWELKIDIFITIQEELTCSLKWRQCWHGNFCLSKSSSRRFLFSWIFSWIRISFCLISSPIKETGAPSLDHFSVSDSSSTIKRVIDRSGDLSLKN